MTVAKVVLLWPNWRGTLLTTVSARFSDYANFDLNIKFLHFAKDKISKYTWEVVLNCALKKKLKSQTFRLGNTRWFIMPVFSSYLFLRNYGHSHHRIYNLRFYRIHSLMNYRVWRRYCSDGLCEYNFDFEYLITNVTKITIIISV